MSQSIRIVKNTFFLYVRMFVIMGITLYTSRIVLKELGVSDYGLYSVVGGFVLLLSFLNSAMASATQRYLSYDIAKGDNVQLNKTFSATLSIHLIIAIIGVLLAETIGLWYINNVLVFPLDRLDAVNIVFQFSILTFVLNIIQVPYNALIVAREQMHVYAFVSVIEALLKLLSVFVLCYVKSDKLIVYAILSFSVALVIRTIYLIYCRRCFPESKYKLVFNRAYFNEILGYSGWNIFGNIAAVSRGQGINMVLNLFYGTAVNAAYSISNQLFGAVNMFVTNFQLAINPPIIKSYTLGNIKESHFLITQGAKFSFYLILIIVIPILINLDYILHLWLGTFPPFTSVFVKLSLINVIIDSLSGTLMTGAQATGKIKWYQIIVGTLVFLNLPISYVCLRMGAHPASVFVVSIFISILSLNFRLYFLKLVMDFNLTHFYYNVMLRVGIVSSLSIVLIYIFQTYPIFIGGFWSFALQSILMISLLVLIILLFGLSKTDKSKIFYLIRKFI